jgi:hypothetical protein
MPHIPHADWLVLYKNHFSPFVYGNLVAALITNAAATRFLTRFPLAKSSLASLMLKSISSATNILAVPLVALVFAMPLLIFETLSGIRIDRSEPLCWLSLTLALILMNVMVEAALLKLLYGYRSGLRGFGVFWLANLLAFTAGIYAMYQHVIAHPAIA